MNEWRSLVGGLTELSPSCWTSRYLASPYCFRSLVPPVVINLESRLAASAWGILPDIRLNLALDEELFRNLFSTPSRWTPVCSAGVKHGPGSGYQVNEGVVAAAKAVPIGNNNQWSLWFDLVLHSTVSIVTDPPNSWPPGPGCWRQQQVSITSMCTATHALTQPGRPAFFPPHPLPLLPLPLPYSPSLNGGKKPGCRGAWILEMVWKGFEF